MADIATSVDEQIYRTKADVERPRGELTDPEARNSEYQLRRQLEVERATAAQSKKQTISTKVTSVAASVAENVTEKTANIYFRAIISTQLAALILVFVEPITATLNLLALDVEYLATSLFKQFLPVPVTMALWQKFVLALANLLFVVMASLLFGILLVTYCSVAHPLNSFWSIIGSGNFFGSCFQ